MQRRYWGHFICQMNTLSNYSAGLRIYCADRAKIVNSAMQRVN